MAMRHHLPGVRGRSTIAARPRALIVTALALTWMRLVLVARADHGGVSAASRTIRADARRPMQVALATVGGTAERARRAADDLVAAGVADLGAADVVVLGERPAAAVPAIVRACDLLVLLVAGAAAGGPGGPDVDAADAVVASAVAARHVAVLAVSDDPLDEATDRWLTRLAIEHPVARGGDLAPLVARCGRRAAALPAQPRDRARAPRPGQRAPRGQDARRGRARRSSAAAGPVG